MLTELQGKAGRLCQEARNGQIRCPLIVRPTSEDVVTGHLFGTLGVLNPRWWLPDLLNEGLGCSRFRRQIFRQFSVQLWRSRPHYPGELLPWDEGSTEVDVTLTWENPPTTVYIEMKYHADLSPKTAGDNGSHGFPSDQLIRNARVGLYECGYLSPGRTLFNLPTRDFVLLLLSPQTDHPLVKRYRKSDQLRAAIPHSNLLKKLPGDPFIGELSFGQLRRVLGRQRRWLNPTERTLVDRLVEYLELKEHQLRHHGRNGDTQSP